MKRTALLVLVFLASTAHGLIVSDGGSHPFSSDIGSTLEVYDSTVDLLSGSSATHAKAYGTSTLNIHSGAYIGTQSSAGNAFAYDFSKMNVSGGTMNSLYAIEFSQVDISGNAYFSGWLSANQNSTITVSGFDHIGNSIKANEFSTIIINGSGFNYPLGELPMVGTLTGTLKDGQSIDIDFARDAGASIVLVPEPSSFALFSIIVLARRKVRQ